MQYKDEKTLHLNKKLGEVIKKLRVSKGTSANKLANEYDLDSGNLSRMENGLIDSKFTTVWKVAEALGIKFSDFAKILEDNLDKDFKLIDE